MITASAVTATIPLKTKSLSANLRRGVMKYLILGGTQIQDGAVRSITSGLKSGRVYVRRGIKHQASAPGQPPAADTGRLHTSIQMIPEPDLLKVTIGPGVQYAKFLEFGTKKMAPRPFMIPPFNATLPKIKANIGKAVRDSLKTGG